jgi:choline-glycine betaine transporter
LVHVPCPTGHVLETPCEMLGEKALCPFCHAQFDLQLEDSLEYKTQMAEQQERREQKSRQIWFYGVIIATAAIVLMLILLILKNVK